MINGTETLLGQLGGIEGVEGLRAALAAGAGPDLHVVVAGEFNSGKSMLVNALLGRRLLTSSPVPTTGQVTSVRFGRRERVRVRGSEGRESEHGLEFLEKLSTLDADGLAAEGVEHVTVFSRARLLEPHLVLVDTPGTNDDVAQTRRALGALATADAVLWVLRADAVLKQGERELAGQWLADNPGAVLAPLVNFMNLVPAGEREAVRRRVTALLEGRYGPRVAWLTALTGRPFFEVDVQRALDWATGGAGGPEADFVALTGWLRGLRGEDGERVKARSRAGRVGTVVRAVRAANRARLLRLRAEAGAARRAREARLREAEARLRHFKGRAETYLTLLEREAGELLSEARDNLLSFWLENESASSLRANTDGWGQMILGEAARLIAEGTGSACQTLAKEFSARAPSPSVPAGAFPVGFSVTLPVTGFFDDLRDFVGAVPTAEYMGQVRARVRAEWDRRASGLTAALRKVWGERVRELQEVIEARGAAEAEADPDGWSWSVTDELVAIKARELWLRRGAPVPSNGREQRDAHEARRLLGRRTSGGEPLGRELLEREAAEAALECLEGRYAGAN